MNEILQKRAHEAGVEALQIIQEMIPHVQEAILKSDKSKATLQISLTFKGNWSRNPTLVSKGTVPNAFKTAPDPKLCADPLQPELPMKEDGAG